MRRSETLNISAIVEAILKQHGLENKLREHRLIKSWESILGKSVSRHTQKLYIKDRVLYVFLNSSIVRNELMMIRNDLLKRLNEKAGAEVIDKIILK